MNLFLTFIKIASRDTIIKITVHLIEEFSFPILLIFYIVKTCNRNKLWMLTIKLFNNTYLPDSNKKFLISHIKEDKSKLIHLAHSFRVKFKSIHMFHVLRSTPL